MPLYLKLIKLDNLLLIALAQLCLKYGLFAPFDVTTTLNWFEFSLLIIATLCLIAANNIMQVIIHKENTNSFKHDYIVISEKTMNNLFIVFNVIGVIIGFYVSYSIGKSKLASLFIIVSGIFYIYQTYLKEILIVKNIIIALLAAFCLLSIGIFDLLPAINTDNQSSQQMFFLIVIDYAVFAFTIIFIREVIKDCLTIDVDYNTDSKTIPIVLGKDRTAKLISILTLIPIGMIVYYIYTYLFKNTIAVLLVLVLLVAPLLFFMFRSWIASTTKDFNTLSLMLKIVLVFASISLVLYQFILK